MKSRAHSLLLGLAKAATRKAFVITSVATLAVLATGMGVLTHKAYAAKAKTEMASKQQAATINDVMAKLNGIESEMQQQTRSLNAKLESLEYQNAKLAAYEVRQHAETPRLELAADRLPMRPAMGVQSSSVEIPLELETDVCAKGNLEASAKLELESRIKAHAEGEVGAEAFGNGANADLDGELDGKLPLDIGGGASLEKSTCLKLAKFNIFGSTPTITEQEFLNTIANVSDGQALAAKLAEIFNELPLLSDSAATSTLDALNNFTTSLSSNQFLANLENPKQTFQNVSSLIGSLPMPGFLGPLFQDPSSLFPKASDFNVTNFCASQGSGGLLSNACNIIPSAVANLSGIQTTIVQFANVQGDLANFKTSLGNLCGSVNNVVSGVDGFSLQIPPANLQMPAGINFTPPSLSFHNVDVFGLPVSIPNGISMPPPTLSFNTVPVGGVTLPSPIHLQPLSCSSL
ncbi:MAG TPA: hypothetical protein VGS59_00640 [Candidatus Acidoferrales bacterium]|nr:hypothetical protein [Candidatus Acidoferrales bacterium]